MATRREFLGGLLAASALAACRGRTPTPSGPPPAAGKLFRAVNMVGRVTERSAVVNLVSAADLATPLAARVRWAEEPAALGSDDRISAVVTTREPSRPLELPLGDLSPNRRYHYLVEYSVGDEPQRWTPLDELGELTTQRTAGEAFDFCVIADAHWGHRDFEFDPQTAWGRNGLACIERILADRPFDFCVELGDAAFPVRARSQEDAFRFYEGYRRMMSPIMRTQPVFVALGNHEHEAGFYQRGDGGPQSFGFLGNGLAPGQHQQRWATEARLRFVPNPRGDTYPEGGEGAPGYDSSPDWGAGSAPWNDGPGEPLQNFYAFTWGDALFVVLDPFRYTLPGSFRSTGSPTEWSLGPTQMRFMEQTLAASQARWKFVICHHQVGGGLIDVPGRRIDEWRGRAYGRGSAVEAGRPGTEQARIHELMRRHGVRFFLYGHDHAFCHSVRDDVHYLLCGRPTWLNPWYAEAGMLASYGNALVQGRNRGWVESLYTVLGYTRFRVTPESVTMEWVRTGYSTTPNVPLSDGESPPPRDWLESWYGREYPVSPEGSVVLPRPPRRIDGLRTLAGAAALRMHRPPVGPDLLDPARQPRGSTVLRPRALPPDTTRVAVDFVPEVLYSLRWTL